GRAGLGHFRERRAGGRAVQRRRQHLQLPQPHPDGLRATLLRLCPGRWDALGREHGRLHVPHHRGRQPGGLRPQRFGRRRPQRKDLSRPHHLDRRCAPFGLLVRHHHHRPEPHHHGPEHHPPGPEHHHHGPEHHRHGPEHHHHGPDHHDYGPD